MGYNIIMFKIFKNLAYICVLVILMTIMVLYFNDLEYGKIRFIYDSISRSFVVPCQNPIVYSIGSIDSKFNLSRGEFEKAINQASNIWSKSIDKQLFVYSSTTKGLQINLIYDYRQSSTDQLKKINVIVGSNQDSYDALKLKYDILNKEYKTEKKILDNLISNYDIKQSAYNKEVTFWNNKGGAPSEKVQSINAEKDYLGVLIVQINNQTDKVNNLINSINAEAVALNKLGSELNLGVANYNGIGSQLGEQFQEGVYVEENGNKYIDIYQFDNYDQLVRLLAHEMGHALGIDHTSSSKDIMYSINYGTNLELGVGDIFELRSVCEIK